MSHSALSGLTASRRFFLGLGCGAGLFRRARRRLQAALQRFHQVDDRSLARLLDFRNLLAFSLLLYKALHILAVFVSEFLRLERRLQMADKTSGQLKLLGGIFRFRRFAAIGFM